MRVAQLIHFLEDFLVPALTAFVNLHFLQRDEKVIEPLHGFAPLFHVRHSLTLPSDVNNTAFLALSEPLLRLLVVVVGRRL